MLNELSLETAAGMLAECQGYLSRELAAGASLHTDAPVSLAELDALRDDGELITLLVRLRGSMDTIARLRALNAADSEAARLACYRELLPLDGVRQLQIDSLVDCGYLQWLLAGQDDIDAVVAPFREAAALAAARLRERAGATARSLTRFMKIRDMFITIFVFGDADQRAALAALPRAAWAPEGKAAAGFVAATELLDILRESAVTRTISAEQAERLRASRHRSWIQPSWQNKLSGMMDALDAVVARDGAALSKVYDTLDEDHETKAVYSTLKHEIYGLMCPWLLTLSTLAHRQQIPLSFVSRYVPDVRAHLLP